MSRQARLRGWVKSRAVAAATAAAYRGWLGGGLAERLIAGYWDDSAAVIAAEWGHGRQDFELIAQLLARYSPRTVLDAGCGSGRLFPLYEAAGVVSVVGTDISEEALTLARTQSQVARLIRARLEDLDFGLKEFDLGICNRVLQHVPPQSIGAAVNNLARSCRLVYVNELTDSDHMDSTSVMRRYDYPALFGDADMDLVETSRLGQQTYFVFGSRTHARKHEAMP